jgi:outer membrane protein OmpA-like peptidoglycan-associated protein
MDPLRKITLICLALVNALCSFAGDHRSGKPDNKFVRKADNLFIFCDYKNALPIYEKLAEANPENAQFNFRLGVCYYYSGTDVLKCLPFFEKAKKSFTEDTEEAIDLYYYLGTTYHMINRFDEAIACYTKLKAFILPDKQGQEDIRDLDNQIAACTRGKEMILHPVNAAISDLGTSVNSEYADYAPIITNDQSMLMFTSKRKECTGGRTDEDGNYYEDVFISRKMPDGDWNASARLDTAEPLRHNFLQFSRSKSLGNSINTREHDASVALSPDGRQLYIYRLDDVWVSDYRNDKWNKPSRLNNFISSKKSHEPSVSLTMDEKTLYFVSEREGGYGGKDIYRSEKQSDGTWGEPQNLGPLINSEYDEDAPFIDSENHTLYFSSEAHGSIGGFDVFKSKLENSSWSVPESMGYPVNSGANDIFYVYNSKEKTAYFSSIRENGLGNYDIYMVDYNPRKPDRFIKTRFAVTLNNQLKNSPTIIEIMNPDHYRDSLRLTNHTTDGGIYKPGETYSITITTPLSGKYTTSFKIPENAKAENYYQEIAFDEIKDKDGKVTGYKTTLYNAFFDLDSAIKNTEFAGMKDKTKAFAAYLQTIKNSDNPALKASVYEEKAAANTIVAANSTAPAAFGSILFEYGEDHISTQFTAEVEKISAYLAGNRSATLKITGYSDSEGDEKFNRSLSERRALSLKKYFIEKGISASRISTAGKGENNPAAPNTNPDGSDNPEGRKLNRRVEFIILSE